MTAIWIGGLVLFGAGFYQAVLPNVAAAAADKEIIASGESPASRRASKLSWHDAKAARQRLRDALATNDYKTWTMAMGDLRNPNLRREESNAILCEVLDHPDWRVRVQAAQELLEQGSSAGVRTLRLALKSAADGVDIPPMTILTAAYALHESQQAIDPNDLQGAYQKHPSKDLLGIAAMQGDAWVEDVIRQKRAAKESMIPTETLAAYLGMNDTESIARYHLLLTLNSQEKVLGSWALYRATGDRARLQYVIDVVREMAGLDSRTEKSANDADSMAIRLLRLTADPQVMKTFEEIMDYEASHKNSRGMGALDSLYFVQKDYDFIDQRMLRYFRGEYADAQNGDVSLLWEIASIRRTPQIEQLALAKNAEGFDYHFIRMQKRRQLYRTPLLMQKGK